MQKFFAKLSDKERKILYVTMVIVILVIFDRALLGPILDKLQNIDSEVQSQENSIKRDTRFLAYQDRINQEYKLYSKYFTDKLGEEDIVKRDFLSKIEDLAGKSNISLAKNTFSHIQKQKDSVEYYTAIDCTGTLENMLSFMYSLNSSDDLLKVIDFNMSPKRGAADEVKVSMTVMKLIMPTGEVL